MPAKSARCAGPGRQGSGLLLFRGVWASLFRRSVLKSNAMSSCRLTVAKVTALGLVFSVCGEFVVAREERAHIELPTYPEVHAERLDAMISTATATVTHHRTFDLPTGPE